MQFGEIFGFGEADPRTRAGEPNFLKNNISPDKRVRNISSK
jgi:hypothetical protein